MRANTLSLALLMLLAGGCVFISSWSFSTLPNQSYGSDTMPRFVGLFGLLVGIGILVQGLREGQRVPTVIALDWLRQPFRVACVIAAIGAVVSYIVLSPIVGFLPVAFAVLMGLMVLRGASLLVAVLVSAVAAVVIQQVFGRILLVPLPRSDFFTLPW